jgi:hypothetical protein
MGQMASKRPGYRYFSRAMRSKHLRISARARKARTFTSDTDRPVSCTISFTERSSIFSSVKTRRAAGESCASGSSAFLRSYGLQAASNVPGSGALRITQCLP